MKEKIILYNHFHNGDIFYSRIITQILSEKYDITYYHNLKKSLFTDVPYVNEIVGIPSNLQQNENFLGGLNINTWIGQKNAHYLKGNHHGCSFSNYFKLVKDISNNLGLIVNESDNYLPIIYFDNLPQKEQIITEMVKFKDRYKKIIFISNGNVNSGQSSNFDMSQLIINLALNNKNCLFLISHDFNKEVDNIVDVSTITKINPDLLQIGFVSTFCDIIIGRASGPHCFTHIKDNLLDVNKTFISISDNPSEGKWFIESIAKQIWTNNYNNDHLYNIINDEIKIK